MYDYCVLNIGLSLFCGIKLYFFQKQSQLLTASDIQ